MIKAKLTGGDELSAKLERAPDDMSLTAVLRRMERGDMTVHGFRSTFRDGCPESVAKSYTAEQLIPITVS